MQLLFNFSEWWNSLSGLSQLYWVIAIPFSLIFIIQSLLSFIGGGFDHSEAESVDSVVEGDHGMGFHFFTFKNMVAFFTLFGWSGLACIKADLSTPLTVIISILAGLLMMLIMATLFYYTSKFTESGNMDIKNAIGKTADVYLRIPAARKGKGKVHIFLQSQIRELDAITDDSIDIPTGSSVEVKEIANNNILVVTKK